MTRFKKISLYLLTFLVVLCFSYSITIAADTNIADRLTKVGTASGYSEVSTYSLPIAAGRIIRAFLSLIGIIFMSYIIYAGYLWMTASGEEEKIRKAKAILRGCIIGLIITLSAYVITATVMDRMSKAVVSTARSVEIKKLI